MAVTNLARWNETSWSTLGTGLDGADNALATYDDGQGTGPALYVLGGFGVAGATAASRIARWGGCPVTTFCTGAGVVFGEGVRCVDGTLIRLAIKQNSGGASQFPEPGHQPVSVCGATPPGSGLTAWHQTYYRSAGATFCPPATLHVTNGVMIRW